MTMGIVPAVAEVIIRTYPGLRTYTSEGNGDVSPIRRKVKQAQLLTLTHGLLASTNVMKTAMYGWNPTALNYAQFLALGKQLFSLLSLSRERNRLIEEQFTSELESILKGAYSL